MHWSRRGGADDRTSGVRVHRHGVFVADNHYQDIWCLRGGPTGEINAVVDTNGLPAVSPSSQSAVFGLLSALPLQKTLLDDRGFRAESGYQGACATARSLGEHFFELTRKDQISCQYLYRARNLIERFFNKIKQCRRVATI
jgi:hypothetical protein